MSKKDSDFDDEYNSETIIEALEFAESMIKEVQPKIQEWVFFEIDIPLKYVSEIDTDCVEIIESRDIKTD